MYRREEVEKIQQEMTPLFAVIIAYYYFCWLNVVVILCGEILSVDRCAFAVSVCFLFWRSLESHC